MQIWQVMSVYMFEALAIILTSVIMATLIGTRPQHSLSSQQRFRWPWPKRLHVDPRWGPGITVAYTLALQYALFNQTDVEIYFPTFLFFFLLCCSFVVSILGSYLPSRKYAHKEIAHTIKGI